MHQDSWLKKQKITVITNLQPWHQTLSRFTHPSLFFFSLRKQTNKLVASSSNALVQNRKPSLAHKSLRPELGNMESSSFVQIGAIPARHTCTLPFTYDDDVTKKKQLQKAAAGSRLSRLGTQAYTCRVRVHGVGHVNSPALRCRRASPQGGGGGSAPVPGVALLRRGGLKREPHEWHLSPGLPWLAPSAADSVSQCPQ